MPREMAAVSYTDAQQGTPVVPQVTKGKRGRKPAIMKFFVAGTEKEITDDAQGDSRETQAEIERMLGMSHDMFKHIVALNTYTEPFLALKANDQRLMIEQLLGITLLSEKADKLKDTVKATKEAITKEEFRIKAVGDANKRIQEQIENLKRRQTAWKVKQEDEITKLATALGELLQIDIDAEIELHTQLAEYRQKKKDQTTVSHNLQRAQQEQVREDRIVKKLAQEIATLENHTCHACGQSFHDDKHAQVLSAKQKELEDKIQQQKEIVAKAGEKDKEKQAKLLKKSRSLYKKHQYFARPSLSSFKSKKSNHIENAKKILDWKFWTNYSRLFRK